MPYNDVISRTDAAALIPEETSAVLLQEIAASNPLLSMARRLPNMSRAQTRMPVMTALALAYFVSGDTGLKQTTELTWGNKYLDAEELAVIVPIPQAVLDDVGYDIWGQVRPELVRAFNKAIAQAVLYGTNIPATWTTNLGAAGVVAAATAAGHVVSAAGFTDLYEALLGESAAGAGDGVLSLIEADGFMANGHLAHVSMRGRLRNVRDANGQPIFQQSMQAAGQYVLDGAPIQFPLDGSMVAGSSLLIAGDWTQLVYAMRQDMTYRMLTEAVITDAGGNIVYNLPQQDMVALRATMRIAVALPNPINAMNETDATRFPFSVLTA